MSAAQKPSPRVTTQTIRQMKQQGNKIAMLTAYDFSFAKLIDEAGIDIILVGDSASNVMAGHETTLPITLDQMIYHGQSVVRAVQRALVVVDLPFGSYQTNTDLAMTSATRIMKETGAHAVKLEGGETVAATIKSLVESGIPVMGHLGLTPQSIYQFGTYKTRAADEAEALQLQKDIKALEVAGCFAVVLEKIPAQLALTLAANTPMPLIGIGAGPHCDGQVLVMHDMLGMQSDFKPRFIRRYANLEPIIKDAVKQYTADVKNNSFPNESESY